MLALLIFSEEKLDLSAVIISLNNLKFHAKGGSLPDYLATPSVCVDQYSINYSAF